VGVGLGFARAQVEIPWPVRLIEDCSLKMLQLAGSPFERILDLLQSLLEGPVPPRNHFKTINLLAAR
jgi:hypothetical protein